MGVRLGVGVSEGVGLTDGRAESAEVVKSVHPILDQEALKAALRCIFKPGKQRDFPVEVWVTLPYRFKLY